MKKLLTFTLVSTLALVSACSRESDEGTGSSDEIEIQRESEIDQGDLSSDDQELP